MAAADAQATPNSGVDGHGGRPHDSATGACTICAGVAGRSHLAAAVAVVLSVSVNHANHHDAQGSAPIGLV